MNLLSTNFANLAFDVLVSMMAISTIVCLIIWLTSLDRKTSATDRELLSAGSSPEKYCSRP